MIAWGIEALIASAVLMATVLALRGPVRRVCGARVAYALWAIPLLRLVLPPLPAAWTHSVAAPIARVSETVTILIVPVVAEPAAAYGFVLALLWGVGAALFLGWHVIAYGRFSRRILRDAKTIDRIGGVAVIEADAAAGPLAFGIIRRYVAFPRDFTRCYDAVERDLVLAHELGHHARGDIAANWLALGILALHWFDPIAWIAFRAFRADQEMANDARVLAMRDPAAAHAYARAIVKSAQGGAISVACHLHTINDLKGRLKMLANTRISKARLFIGSAAIGLIALTGLGLTASGTQAADTIKAAVGVDFAQMAGPPAPPVPPAPAIAPEAPMPPAAPRFERRTITVRDDNGRLLTENVIGVPDVPDVASASSRDCGNGGDRSEMVIKKRSGGEEQIVICTNRIEKAAAEGAAIAANSKDIERHALQSALAGLRSARAGLLAGRGMDNGGNRAAMPAIEEAIAEVESDLAKVN